MNVESIAEVKVLTSGYQAEYGRSSGLQITAVTKSGTNRFRGSVYDVQRNSDWNANSKVNKLNGDPEDGPEGKGSGASRSAARSASPAATTSCSSSTARSSRRAPPATTCSASGSRPRSSAPATSRRRSTTTARSTTSSRIRRSGGRLHADDTSGCFADGGVLGKIPANRLYQTGLNILKQYPLPNAGVRRASATTTRSPGRRRRVLSWQPALRVDYQPTPEAARDVQVLRAGSSGAIRFPARCPASTTRRCSGRSISNAGVLGQLQPEQHDCSSRAPTAAAGTSWPAARWRRAAPGRRSAAPRSR